MTRTFRAALLSSALLAPGVQAQEIVEWWDFLGGGDGVRMKQLISDFNAEHAGEIQINATTLDWGIPFYTKVQTAAAVGEGPDIMTYHASRIPLAVSQGTLAPITPEDLAAMGLSPDSFAPSTWEAVNVDGTTYAIPFDTHPIVLYYNKDMLEAAGLIGEDGLPTGLDGLENFNAALQTLKDNGAEWAIAQVTADGGFAFRTIYSLLCQQGGTIGGDGDWFPGDSQQKLENAVQVIADWVANGYNPSYTDYPTTVALFTSGAAPFMINGVWEVPTMTDLAARGELFEWGAIELPVLFDRPCTYADSHAFAIPNNVGKPPTAEKHAAVLEVIRWMSEHSLFWATAGHIPANLAVIQSEEYQTMEPQATYASLIANMVFDPKSIHAGVASALFEEAGNAFTAAMNGEVDAATAVAEMKAAMDRL
ncbi:carbohydrate ABC transporter substrate-binding protein, CUT1 family [Rubellimicrobium thermophilum DSM 16684]|uniref:Carbohydrate ABC transporter substrate-binding protein, CUT1 family n=1 Tax=Rubellimicrobium thermophilum DSM 16684 TaxID=1123069 RepID=S9R267_9RHOB|nr:extracellular solute-binding protein [Rubellimicrobium thermophilum]EPX87761.1 carbohydrate ABC transporter substrate-binding protein, CUT1 family [Rubellimicrobium thermophilum DSM 16684]